MDIGQQREAKHEERSEPSEDGTTTHVATVALEDSAPEGSADRGVSPAASVACGGIKAAAEQPAPASEKGAVTEKTCEKHNSQASLTAGGSGCIQDNQQGVDSGVDEEFDADEPSLFRQAKEDVRFTGACVLIMAQGM
jgi:hypothetical protein